MIILGKKEECDCKQMFENLIKDYSKKTKNRDYNSYFEKCFKQQDEHNQKHLSTALEEFICFNHNCNKIFLNRGEFEEHYDKEHKGKKLQIDTKNRITIPSLTAYHNKKTRDSENENIEDKENPNYCNYHKTKHPSKKISKRNINQNNLKFFQLLAKQENIIQDIKTGTTCILSYNKMNSLKKDWREKEYEQKIKEKKIKEKKEKVLSENNCNITLKLTRLLCDVHFGSDFSNYEAKHLEQILILNQKIIIRV